MKTTTLLDQIPEYRERMAAYRSNLSETLTQIITARVVYEPAVTYKDIIAITKEIKAATTYIDRLHEIEKTLLTKEIGKSETDYVLIRKFEDYVGIIRNK